MRTTGRILIAVLSGVGELTLALASGVFSENGELRQLIRLVRRPRY